MNGQIMKGIVAAFAGVFLIACAGCGGGGGGSTPEATKTVQPPKPVIIDAEGDSTIYGYQKINGQFVQTPNSAPVILQQIMQKQFGSTVTVENKGIGGADIKSSVQGLGPYYSAPFATRLATEPAQIVLENYGLNDSKPGGVSESDYKLALEQWVDAARQAGKIAVLEEPNPACDDNHANLGAYVAIIDQVAQEKGVPLIQQYAHIQSLPNWQTMLTDCVHPTDALYKIKAENEAAQLRPLISSLM